MVKWYSLFSHTGKETEAVQELMKDKLHLETALTTNADYEGPLPCVKLTCGKYVNRWLTIPGNVEPNSIITLNGYMRILPEEVINYLHAQGCQIFNIHPAPIKMYPDLKGKDPQERLYEGIQNDKYHFIGIVIHEVDAGVDTGTVRHWSLEMADPNMTKEELYQHLHDMGTQMWVEFLEEVIRLGENRKGYSA